MPGGNGPSTTIQEHETEDQITLLNKQGKNYYSAFITWWAAWKTRVYINDGWEHEIRESNGCEAQHQYDTCNYIYESAHFTTSY